MIQETAYAKINLTLSVGRKRADGYHDIDSVMHSISLADTITLEKADTVSLAVVKGSAPAGRDNLMVKAAELFLQEKHISSGVSMTLAKEIPSEAGMGGGSSDAAAILRGLSALYETGDTPESLAAMGASLGADVPFCVIGDAARCTGIGDKLTALPPWEALPLLIVRPQASVSTAKAYAAIDALPRRRKDSTEDCVKALETKDRRLLLSSLANDFEDALFPMNPILKETAATLRSLSRPVLMTGSGSAFFLVLENREEAAPLRSRLKKAHPFWFVEEAETLGKH